MYILNLTIILLSRHSYLYFREGKIEVQMCGKVYTICKRQPESKVISVCQSHAKAETTILPKSKYACSYFGQ